MTNESAPTVILLLALVEMLVRLTEPNCAVVEASVGALPRLQFVPVVQLPLELSSQVSVAACAEGSAAATARTIEVRLSCFRPSRRVGRDLLERATACFFKIRVPGVSGSPAFPGLLVYTDVRSYSVSKRRRPWSVGT